MSAGRHRLARDSEDGLEPVLLRRYGRFFFLPTDQAGASTRRFEARGYLRQDLRWLIEALMPLRHKLHRTYDVVR